MAACLGTLNSMHPRNLPTVSDEIHLYLIRFINGIYSDTSLGEQ